jgi:hypothetical protein
LKRELERSRGAKGVAFASFAASFRRDGRRAGKSRRNSFDQRMVAPDRSR